MAIVVGLDPLDELAVVALGEDPGDFVLEVEAFTEDDRRHAPEVSAPAIKSAAVGVSSSSACSECARRN